MKKIKLNPRHLLLFLLFCLLWAVMYRFVWHTYEREASAHKRDHTEVLRSTLSATQDQLLLANETILKFVVQRPEVLQIFARGVNSEGSVQTQARQALYDTLLPLYRQLDDANIHLLHFHTREMRSFLRFHLPDKHSDDLSDKRPGIIQSNRAHQTAKGFEIGRLHSGLRTIIPLFYEGEHLGSVEVSITLDHLQASLKRRDPAREYRFLLDKRTALAAPFSGIPTRYQDATLHPGFFIQPLPDQTELGLREIDNRLAAQQTVIEGLKRYQDFTIALSTTHQDWCVSFVSIRSIDGQPAGYLVSYSNHSRIPEMHQVAISQLIVGSLLLIGFFWAAMMFQASWFSLRRNKCQLETIMDTIGDGVYVTDQSGRITHVNRTFCELLGYSADQVLNQLPDTFFQPTAEATQGSAQAATDTQVQDAILVCQDGRELHVEIDRRPMLDQGSVVGVVAAFRDVTQKRQIEQSNLETQQLLSSIVENLPIMLSLKRADTLEYTLLNKAGEALLGIDRTALIGQTGRLLFSEKQFQTWYNIDQQALASDAVIDIPRHPMETPDQGIRILHTRKFTLRNQAGEPKYLLGIAEDITELDRYRRHLEECIDESTADLKAAHARYQHLLNNIGDDFLVYSLTPAGLLSFASKGLETVFGVSIATAIGQHWTRIAEWNPASLQQAQQHLHELLAGQREISQLEIGFIHPQSRSERCIYTSTRLVRNETGEPRALEGVLIDITARKRTEKALHNAKLLADQANQAKTVFLANMSHEIRTPMIGVLGMAEMLLDSRLTDAQRKMIQVIHDSANQQLNVVNDLLDAAKIESGSIDLQTTSFSLLHLIGQSCSNLFSHAKRMGVALQHAVAADIPEFVEGDPTRITQVLNNFLSNAIKFSSGIERSGEVQVIAKLADHQPTEQLWIELSVRDNGIGMDTQQAQALVEPNPHSDQSQTFLKQGLGLLINSRLIEAMGGRIAVSSNPGQGSTFSAILPLGIGTRPDTIEQNVAPNQSDSTPILPSREDAIRQGNLILVVEDNETNQAVIEQQLHTLGYRCDLTADGHEALTSWLGGDYGLVLSDLRMPRMDGYQLIKAIRAVEQKSHASRTPFLAITANAVKDERQRCLDFGMDDCLIKPVALAQLREALDKWLTLPTQVASKSSEVVIIDDDTFIHELINSMLLELGYPNALTFESAEDALPALRELDQSKRVVLLDINMPGMDGIELVEKLADRRFTGCLIPFSGEDEIMLRATERLAKESGLFVPGSLQKPPLPQRLSDLLRQCDARKKIPQRRVTQGDRKIYEADEIQRAIADREFVNFYQPKVAIPSGEWIGVETLIRWQHPRDGMVFPDQFIPVAESEGLISDITLLVMRQAIQQAAVWHQAGLDLRVAINVSMDDLSQMAFADFVTDQVNAKQLPSQNIVLEVTEGQLMQDYSTALKVLTRLRLKRFRLSIDDFGTGHSSLAQLRDLPFDELKIDKSFVHKAGSDERLAAIFGASLEMAKRLNMETVAEGVEDQADWTFLRTTEAQVAQGYFIARPLPESELLAWHANWEKTRSRLQL